MAPLTETMAPITDISQLDMSQSYSYADYLNWKFSEYVELIKGRVLRKISAPTSRHQQCSMTFSGELNHTLRENPAEFLPPLSMCGS